MKHITVLSKNSAIRWFKKNEENELFLFFKILFGVVLVTLIAVSGVIIYGFCDYIIERYLLNFSAPSYDLGLIIYFYTFMATGFVISFMLCFFKKYFITNKNANEDNSPLLSSLFFISIFPPITIFKSFDFKIRE